MQLSVLEAMYAMSLAVQRDACKKNRSSRYSRKFTGFGVHCIGTVAELCYAKAYNGKMSLDVSAYGDGHRPDVILPDGKRVEVKGITYDGPKPALKLDDDEIKHPSEWYALVVVTLPDQGKILGTWSWQHIQQNIVNDPGFGYGPRNVFYPQQ